MNNSVLCQKGLGLHAKQKMKMHSEGFFFSPHRSRRSLKDMNKETLEKFEQFIKLKCIISKSSP